jgi:hypothetical protein
MYYFISIAWFNLQCEKLRRSIWILWLRSNFTNPWIFWRRFFSKNINLVICHSFLSNNHFFWSIYDEVSTLIKTTIFSISYSLHFIKLFKLAEFRSQHYWNFTNKNSFFFSFIENVFHFFFSFLSFLIFMIKIFQLFLRQMNVCKYFSWISKISNSCIMRKQRSHWIITLKMSWMFTNRNLTKFNFPNNILCCVPFFSCNILRNNINLNFSDFINNFLHIKLKKSVIWRNLLRD